jgi:hypothetical protein
MSSVLPFSASAVVTVPASSRLAVYSDGPYEVIQIIGFANAPTQQVRLFLGSGAYTSSVFTSAANIQIAGGANALLYYSVGTDAVVTERMHVSQATPVALNATGALTAAAMLSGIVTSTTAAAVTGTMPTGTVLDAAATFAIGDAFDWSVVNTGGTNAFTVAGATGNTLVGSGAVAALNSHQFRTTKTAANAFITYRI